MVMETCNRSPLADAVGLINTLTADGSNGNEEKLHKLEAIRRMLLQADAIRACVLALAQKYVVHWGQRCRPLTTDRHASRGRYGTADDVASVTAEGWESWGAFGGPVQVRARCASIRVALLAAGYSKGLPKKELDSYPQTSKFSVFKR